jgi:hypothetical protein
MENIPENFWNGEKQILCYNITKTEINKNILNKSYKYPTLIADIYSNKKINNMPNIKTNYKDSIYDLIIYNNNKYIYESEENKIKKINRFINMLNDDGYLIYTFYLNDFKLNKHILKNIISKYDIISFESNLKLVFDEFAILLLQKKFTENIMTQSIITFNNSSIIEYLNMKELGIIEYIPKLLLGVSISVISKIITKSKKLYEIYEDWPTRISTEMNEIYNYKIYHTDNEYYYTGFKLDNYESKKLILNKRGIIEPKYIEEECNIGYSYYYIVVENEDNANKIINKINEEDTQIYLTCYCINGENNKDILKYLL